MQILVAPNAFKESLEADRVAHSLINGLKASDLSCDCDALPIADGGDGSLPVIAQYLDAEVLEFSVKGPLGDPINARFGWQRDQKIGIVELAEASGIRHLSVDQLDPWQTSTFGTGELIKMLVEKGAEKIYLTVGGSATVDGALGILSALGTQFFDDHGAIDGPLTSDLIRISSVDLSKANALLANTSLHVLCDVNNPLLGSEGSAAVFGPQKGAKPEDVEKLEAGLSNLARVIERDFGRSIGTMPHAGAAGGVAGVLHGFFGAELINGGEQILKWAAFDQALEKADVVITGEGKIDEQTAYGKGPGLVAKKAKDAGKYVIGICGMVSPEPRYYDYFDWVFPVTNGPQSLKDAFANTEKNLERTGMMLGRMLKFGDR